MDKVRAEIEATGVARFEYNSITVNSTDIISEMRTMLDMIPFEKDYNGAFAARVKLEVELLGDMQKGAEQA